jgi:hypothetical protein
LRIHHLDLTQRVVEVDEGNLYLPPVYKETSGWVHLSANHIHSTWQVKARATEELFGYVEGWERRKGLPLGQARPRHGDGANTAGD